MSILKNELFDVIVHPCMPIPGYLTPYYDFFPPELCQIRPTEELPERYLEEFAETGAF